MHRWVARREKNGTIESALELAAMYEDEFGSPVTPQAPVVTANTRSVTQRPVEPAVESPIACQTVKDVSKGPTTPLDAQMRLGFKRLQKQLTTQFMGINSRLRAVENKQRSQTRRWEQQHAAWVPAGRLYTDTYRRPSPEFRTFCKPDRYYSYDKRAADRMTFPQRRDDGWRPRRNFHRYDGYE